MIKVNGKDFSATVSGTFSLALNAIKSIAGRNYNTQTKVWTVPVCKSDFIRAMKGFAIDFSDGSHMTSYKNYRNSKDWEVQQKMTALKAERSAAVAILNSELRFHCESISGDKAIASKLVNAVYSGIERAMFSTEERYELASIVQDWYEFAQSELNKKFEAKEEVIESVYVQ